MTTELPMTVFTSWLAQGERGLSSEAIVSHLTRQRVGRREFSTFAADYPHDPDDFRRCELLLRQVPLARLMFASAMPSRSPEWAALVASWDEIAALLEAEVPGVYDAIPWGSKAPKSYALMRQLLDGARAVSGGLHD